MDKKTYEVLGRIIEGAQWYTGMDELKLSAKGKQLVKDVEQVKGWMEEVAKDYDEDTSALPRAMADHLEKADMPQE